MAAAAREVVYQKCDIDLQKKTQWHIDINGGFVPFWETPKGDIIIESKVVMDYIEEAYPSQGYSFLPADPVLRAKNRLGYSLIDGLNGAWYPMFFKKSSDEAGIKLLQEKLQKIEDFIKANNKNQDKSPFVQGTENPTQLDAHIYVHVERINMMKGSAWHDTFWVPTGFHNFPLLEKLLEAIRARPEFAGILANPKPWHELIKKCAEAPEGVKVGLYLPIENE